MKKIIVCIAVVIVAIGLYAPIVERFYTLDFGQDLAKKPVHIVLLSDIHSGTFYLQNLLEKLKAAKMCDELDAIFLLCDIVDDEVPIDGAIKLLESLNAEFADLPRFFVAGNHEFWGDIAAIKQLMQTHGVLVLDANLPNVCVRINKWNLRIVGVDDPVKMGVKNGKISLKNR